MPYIISDLNNEDLNGNAKIDKKKLIEYFGELYALKPEKFRFQPGDRKFIKLIQQTITKTIETKGRKKAMQHFGCKYEPPKKKMLKDNQNGHSNTGDTKCTTANIECITANTDLTDLANEMKAKLFKQILDKLKTFAVPKKIIDIFNETFISVNTEDNEISEGNVVCVVCYAESKNPHKIKPTHVYCRTKSGRLSWVISNYMKHFRRAHPSIQKCKAKDRPSNEQHFVIEVNDNSCSSENTSIGNISCDIMNMPFESTIVEMDSVEQQLNEEISKQMVKMWSITTLHCDDLECGVQSTDIDHLFISFDVVQIHGDGDCLFSSAAHQIFGKDINSSEHKILTGTLRKNVVEYIQGHYEDFVFDIRGHVHELKEIAAKDHGCDAYGFNTIANIDDACKYFVDNCLIQPGFWGGAESLKAIHFLHKVDIIVFNENGPITFYNANNEQINHIIALAYRVSADHTTYNHYDSVCNLTHDVIYSTANVISKRLTKKNTSVINLDTTK